jgi:hypothetical protein
MKEIVMQGLMLDTPESGPCSRAVAFAEHLIPKSTATYQAVPNEELIRMIGDCARKHGLVLGHEELGLDLKGMRMFGTYEIESHDFLGDQVKLMMGIRNSYNRSMSIRVCFGAKVFVCSNMSFHAWADDETGIIGDVGHRHTPNVNDGLWQRLDYALGQVDKFAARQEQFYRYLSDRPLTDDEAYSFIVRSAKKGAEVISKARILDVVDEWDRQGIEPETEEQAEAVEWHPEFQNRNAWSLFNAFTQKEKNRLARNPVASNMGTLGLTSFFHREFVTN